VRARVALLSGLAAVAWAPGASAYCRTTTVHEPAGYDPAVDGCWPQGTVLHWAAGSVTYVLSQAASQQVSLADAEKTAQVAFAAWDDAECSGAHPGLVTTFGGTIDAAAAADDCGLVQCDPTFHDPQHVIVFDDAMWPHNDPSNTIALTTVTYGVDDGVIFDADIEVNTHDHKIAAVEPPQAGTIDLQAVLTHEAGHFYGLAHATDVHSVMYAFYQPGAIKLTQDDIAGVCAASPPSSPSSGRGCACDAGEPGAGWIVAGAAAVLLGGALRRRRPRR
jgi:MYXO-CTERM domain-containing protein